MDIQLSLTRELVSWKFESKKILKKNYIILENGFCPPKRTSATPIPARGETNAAEKIEKNLTHF